MQKMKLGRRRWTFGVVIVGVIIGLLAGVFVSRDSDDGDDNGEGPVRAGAGGSATVIVVDDFGGYLSQLALSFDDPEDLFGQAAGRLKEMGEPSDKGDYMQEIIAIVEELYGQFGEQAQERLGGKLSYRAQDNNCVINTEGLGFFGAGGTGFFGAGGTGFFGAGGTGQQSAAHGYRVRALLDDLNSRFGSDVTIEIVPVDTENFDIRTLGTNLVQAVIDVRDAKPDEPIVVNLSFGIIPCESIATLAVYEGLMLKFDAGLAEDLAWLREIFRAMVGSGALSQKALNDPSLASTFCETPEKASESDLCQSKTEVPLILVGAAGNGSYEAQAGNQIGDPFPYIPAAWGEVIAISANEDDADFITVKPRAMWSNAGLVLMPGRWHWVNEELGIDREEIGTSFAAPRYSYMTALKLAGSAVDVGCAAGDIPDPAQPHDWIATPNPPRQDEPPCARP
jgi:hypothetical protein